MSKVLFDNDRSFYNLSELKLCEISSDDDAASSYEVVQDRRFRVIGKGGFGSIFVGTIPKTREFSTRDYDHDTCYLGWYHGVLLQGRKLSSEREAAGVSNSKLQDQQAATKSTCVTVAVKRNEVSEDQLRDFYREVLTLNALWGRRNIVANYGPVFSLDLKCVCIVLELVDGCTLNQFLRSRGRAALKVAEDVEGQERIFIMSEVWKSNEVVWWMEKLRLFREIVLALILCHRLQVYHGDLKGDNILVDRTSLVPKVIDFGMSFRRVDKSYMRELGGSLLWMAPEVMEEKKPGDELWEEVLNNPYPSDIYSLGAVLAEILVDGEVPQSVTDSWYLLCLRYEDDEPPFSLTSVTSDDTSFQERILESLKALVIKCCCGTREQRISLLELLATVDDIYEELWSSFHLLPAAGGQRISTSNDQHEVNDRHFIQCQGYRDMLDTSRLRFPSVREHRFWSPSRNPVMDEDGTLLVHHFCKLDFAEGVRYIVESKSCTWDFQAERDVPYMALECVRGGSTDTLRYLATSWPDVMREQLLLAHVACEGHDNHGSRDLLDILLNVGINFETWQVFDKSGGYLDLLTPIQKLANWGKKEMLRTLLEYFELHPERFSNRVFEVDLVEAVLCSVTEDQIETLDLLLQGKRLQVVEHILLHPHENFDLHSRLELYNPKYRCATLFGTLFAMAIHGKSRFPKLNVAIALLERDYCNSQLCGERVLDDKRRMTRAPEHLNILKKFVADYNLACSSASIAIQPVDPVIAACRKGNEDVIDALFWLMAPLDIRALDYVGVPAVVHDIVFRIASHGSKSMVEIIRSHGVKFRPHQRITASLFADRRRVMEDALLRPRLVEDHDNLTLLDVSRIYNNKEITDHFLQQPRVTTTLMRLLGDTLHPKNLEPEKSEKNLELEKEKNLDQLEKSEINPECSEKEKLNLDQPEKFEINLEPDQKERSLDQPQKSKINLEPENEKNLDQSEKSEINLEPEKSESSLNKLRPVEDHGRVSYAKILVLLDAYGLNLDRLVLRLQAAARISHCQGQLAAPSSCSQLEAGHRQSSSSTSTRISSVWYEHSLHVAAYHGKVHIVKYLLKRGFPVDFAIKEKYNGSTALFRTCASKQMSREQKEVMVRTLLDAGADPNHKDSGGYTAMDVVLGSSDHGWRELFHLLVQAGFNLGDLDQAGESYMSIALRLHISPDTSLR